MTGYVSNEQSSYLVGLKQIVILVFEYSYSFQFLLNNRKSNITAFSGEMMLVSVD